MQVRLTTCRKYSIQHLSRNLLKIKNEDEKHEKASLVKSLSHNIIPGREEENKKIENNVRYLHLSPNSVNIYTLLDPNFAKFV